MSERMSLPASRGRALSRVLLICVSLCHASCPAGGLLGQDPRVPKQFILHVSMMMFLAFVVQFGVSGCLRVAQGHRSVPSE